MRRTKNCKNILVIGSTASGKSTIAKEISNLIDNYDFIDVGVLYRLVAYLMFKDENKDAINNMICSVSDKKKIDLFITKKLPSFKAIKTSLWKNIKVKSENGSPEIYYGNYLVNNLLKNFDSNLLSASISKYNCIRVFINDLLEKITNKERGCILTGHNLRDTDTCKYLIVFLKTSKEIACERYTRTRGNIGGQKNNPNVFNFKLQEERWQYSESILNRTNGVICINNDENDVFGTTKAVIQGLEQRKKEEDSIISWFASNSIDRTKFTNLSNPIMDIIGKKIRALIDKESQYYDTDRRNLAINALQEITQYDYDLLFSNWKNEYEIKLHDSLKNRIINRNLIKKLDGLETNDKVFISTIKNQFNNNEANIELFKNYSLQIPNCLRKFFIDKKSKKYNSVTHQMSLMCNNFKFICRKIDL